MFGFLFTSGASRGRQTIYGSARMHLIFLQRFRSFKVVLGGTLKRSFAEIVEGVQTLQNLSRKSRRKAAPSRNNGHGHGVPCSSQKY